MAYQQATWLPAIPAQFFTDAGLPAAGYQLFTYAAGTATKVTTYTEPDLSVSNTDPIVLDSAGRCVCFLAPGTYKFILATPTSADPPAAGDIIWTRDNIGSLPTQDSNVDILGVPATIIAAGDCVVPSTLTGRWVLSDPALAERSVDASRIGFAVTANTPTTVTVRLSGKITIPAGGLVAGATYYLSDTPGALSATPPVGAYHAVPVAMAVSADEIIFPHNSEFRVGARQALKSFAYSVGQGNDATTVITELTNYAVSIPAGTLDQPGACLIIEGVCLTSASAPGGTFHLQLGANRLTTVFESSGGTAQTIPFRVKLFRRTAASGAYNGIAHIGATAAGAPTNYMLNCATSAVWTTGQVLHAYAHSASTSPNDADKIVLTDYTVYVIRSYEGATV